MSSASEPLASPLLSALDRMQAVLRRLGAVQDQERLYAEAVREAAGFFGATQSCLALYEPQTGTMRFQRPAIGLDEAQLQALSAIPAEHIALLLHNAPEHSVVPVLVAEHVHLSVPGLVDRLNEQDVLLALMRAEGQVVGMFRLANRADGAAFTREQVHLLGLFASQLGVLIQNLRLLANEQRARRLAETLLKVPQVVRQPLLADGTPGVARDDAGLQVLLTRLLELLHQVIAYSSACIALVENGHLRIVASRTDTGIPNLVGYSWDASTDPKVAAMVASGQPLSIPDTRRDPRWILWEGAERILAWIGAPIHAPDRAPHERGDLIGTLNVDGACLNAFDASDVTVVQAFADQIAIVLENQRLYTDMARRAAELALVNQVSTALNASLDLPAVLQSTATQLALALNVEQCGLVLFDRERRLGRIVAEYQRQPDDTAKDVLIPIQGNLSLARILETKSPLPIRDAQHDPLMVNVQEVMIARGVKSILLLPLIVHGEVIGTVGLDELKELRDFNPAEIALAQTITNQAATAVANAQLFKDVQRRVTQLQTIQEVTHRISAILNPKELLAQVSDLLCARFGYYHVHVFLVDETGEYLVAHGGSGKVGRRIVADRLRLRMGDQGICGLAASAGQTIVVNDVRADPRYQPHRLLTNTRAEAAVPITLGAQVVGLLDVQSEQIGAFDETDRFVLETFADQVAIALENARLYQIEQARALELTNAYEELKALDRMKDEFVQTVSHELRTPLTFIKGYVELLQEGVMGDVNDEQRNALRIIAQRTENLIHLVGEIISFARADSVGLTPLPVSLAEIADGAVQSAQAVAVQLGLELATDFEAGLPLVQGDVQRLTQVFDNLIGNAVKFSPHGGMVTVRLRSDDHFVRAEVIDQGIGIPLDAQSRIWERFYQVDGTKTRRFGGTGLGLAIVKRLVEAHGGRVGVRSVEDQGSTFYFTVPRADV
ncbi:MAG: GAF domain-containing protein [Chloroflexi bacterium]|nr:GAF domain-containing protein [Chloroflexota bacterium]